MSDTFSGFASPNGTYTPNQFLDRVLGGIEDMSELKVTLCVIRFTLGYHRRAVKLSQTFIVGWTGLSRNAVRRGLEAAITRKTVIEIAPFLGREPATYALRFADEIGDADAEQWNFIFGETRKNKKPKPAKEGAPEGYQEMFNALAVATRMDTRISSVGAQTGKEAKELLKAGYAAAQVAAAYGEGGWWQQNWRGKSGGAPTLNQIKTTIAEALKAGSPEYVEVR